jgi:hypothetical protein
MRATLAASSKFVPPIAARPDSAMVEAITVLVDAHLARRPSRRRG